MDKSELIEEFSKCRKNLERYAVSLTGNIKDAEDLVSDLCIAILERNTDVEEIRFPKAFFKTSLRHKNTIFYKYLDCLIYRICDCMRCRGTGYV